MAITYTLDVDTDTAPSQLHEIVSAPIATESDPALEVWTGQVDDNGRQWIREDYGFEARVYVYFRLDKFNLEGAQDLLTRCLAYRVAKLPPVL